MLEKFFNLKICILKAIVDIKLESIWISEKEFRIISNIVGDLKSFEIGIEHLEKWGNNLLEAEGVLIFICKDLESQKN